MMDRLLHDLGFVIHLTVYAAVNLLLFLINVFTDPNTLWFYWPLLGWGLGLLGHAYAVNRSASSHA